MIHPNNNNPKLKMTIEGELSHDFYLSVFSMNDRTGFSLPEIKVEFVCDTKEYHFVCDWMEKGAKKKAHVIYLGQIVTLFGCFPKGFTMNNTRMVLDISCDRAVSGFVSLRQIRKLKLEKLGIC